MHDTLVRVILLTAACYVLYTLSSILNFFSFSFLKVLINTILRNLLKTKSAVVHCPHGIFSHVHGVLYIKGFL